MKGRLNIDKAQQGKRLDVALAQILESVSRSRLQAMIREGHVRLNGQTVRSSTTVRERDMVEYNIVDQPNPSIHAQNIPLRIIYEDQSIMVIDKPPGLVVHPGAGNPDGTVANALLFHLNRSEVPGQTLRPGIVHRLDKDTSGILVLAKTEDAHARLSQAFAMREVTKTYIAVCRGSGMAQAFHVENNLIRSSANRLKFTGKRGEGRHALTCFALVAEQGNMSLVLARPKTGRTHQIRVHLSELGHPVLGDSLYGGMVHGNALSGLGRQALHAYKIVFSHPVSNEKLVFTVPPPRDMTIVIEMLFGPEWPKAVALSEEYLWNG